MTASPVLGTAEPSNDGDLDPRFLTALCLTTFLAALNFFAVTPFYSSIASDLDSTVPLIGQVTTLMILISAGLGLVIGPLSDRFGQRTPLIVGILAVAVNLIGMGLATSYPMLLALSVTGGLADAIVFNLPFAIIGRQISGIAQRKAMSFAFASLSAAPILGVPILTFIGDLGSWRTALICAGVTATGCSWLVWNAVPADRDHAPESFHFRQFMHAYLPLIRDRHVMRLYGVTIGRSITWFGALTYLGAFLSEELNLNTRAVGLVYTVTGLGAICGSAIGIRISLYSARKVVACSCLATSVLVALLFLFPDLWGAVPLVFVGAALSAMMGIGITSMLAAESSAGSGTTQVLNGSLLNLGAATAAAFGGLLLSTSGYRALGIGLPVFAVGAAALAIWPDRADRSGNPVS